MFDRLWPNASPRLVAWLTSAAVLAALLQTIGFIFQGSGLVGFAGALIAGLAFGTYAGATGRPFVWAMVGMFPLLGLALGYLGLYRAAPVANAPISALKGFCKSILVFILLAASVSFLYTHSDLYIWSRYSHVAGALDEMDPIKASYSDFYVSEFGQPGMEDIGIKSAIEHMPGTMELNGIKAIKQIKIGGFFGETEVERRIQFTANQIIISFGPGFDGNEEKTLIVEVSESQGSLHWDCTKGTLSDRYRPLNCR